MQREAHEDKVRGLAARADALQADVASRRHEAHERAAEVEERKREVVAQYEALQRCATGVLGLRASWGDRFGHDSCTFPLPRRSCEAELTRLRVELRSALEMMLQHRMHVQHVLANASGAVQRAYQELQQVPMPAAVMV